MTAKPLTESDNWNKEAKILLFAHNHMTREQLALDPHDCNPGTRVGGRMLDMLRKNGYQTSGNTVDGNSHLMAGDSYYGNPAATVSSGGAKQIDEISSLNRNEMLNLVKEINGEGLPGNSMFGETWSERLSKALFEYDTSIEIDKAMKNGEFNLDGYKTARDGVQQQLKSVAMYMKLRHMRNVDRGP